MADVVLFHHALGLTPAVRTLGDRLREAGHTVATPDLYDGATFDELADGIAHADDVGFGTVTGRGVAAVGSPAPGTVFVGISLGVLPAQQLAQTTPGAGAAVLVGSCVPAATFGGWPADVPVQIHAMDADPIFTTEGDLEAARELVAGTAAAQLFLYPGDAHLFTEFGTPAYDAAATDLFLARTLDLLRRVDEQR